ncbi:MAG: TonB-dependent receptor [Aureispira sp.]|nr:TonB-dependent receptor [Aureispira sp.]
MKQLNTILLILCTFAVYAQDNVQTIRGKIVDKETKQPLIGVSVVVANSEPLIGASTDLDGNFELANVPVGRQIVQTQYIGYQTYATEDFIVSSAKAIYLEIEMIEAVETTEEIVVTANANNGGSQALNELSVVSTRSFSVEETQRYAGSINDPGRMAMAFPGVQANQDTENDIVVRGNSAFGVLWRVEGLDVPNPNHFARPATTGGGISVFSASLLSNSDFSTGAFAAEYGNAFSGVFDVRFRKGNLVNREYTFRAGLIGLDFATEGPIKKGQSSYLINYRYSTLGILGAMGIHVVRANATNSFQDLSFNLYFNSKDHKNTFTIFGMGGLSDEDWSIRDSSLWESSLDYGWNDNRTNLGVLGMTYTRLLDDKSYLKIVAGGQVSQIIDYQAEPISANTLDTMKIESDHYIQARGSVTGTYSRKINNQFRIKAGLMGHFIHYNLEYGQFMGRQQGLVFFLGEDGSDFGNGKGDVGNTFLMQAYAQGSYRPTEKLTLNAGLHSMFLAMNNTWSIEPRVSMKYQLAKSSTFTLAYGMHSKMLPIGTYLLKIPTASGGHTRPNKNLPFSKAHHAVLGFEQIIAGATRIQAELYYQYLYDIPIGVDSNTTFWLYNMRDNFGTRAMQNGGTGQNYGLDLTIEKFFGKGFFILCTGSLYWSQYRTANGRKWRSTRLDGRWASSFMGGKEFYFKKGLTLQLGLKAFFNGGQRYTHLDLAASKLVDFRVDNETDAFNNKFHPYFRMDARVALRHDLKKLSYTVSVDIQNATNAQNPRAMEYDRFNNSEVIDYNSGLLPVISFQIDF